MLKMSEQIGELAAAMSKAQAVMEGASKGKVNPAFKSKYADLASVWDACRDALTSNGLAVMQFPGEMVDNRMTMTTVITHSGGQWMSDTLSIPLTKVDAQGYGSATSYARRYALAAVVGVCPEDDDGNAASTPKREAAPSVITPAQLAELQKLASEAKTDLVAFCDYYKIEALPDLPANRFEHAKGVLTKRLPQREAA